MGRRGRAKAKQTKVARDLKYHTYDPDLQQLQRELSGEASDTTTPGSDDADIDEVDDAPKERDEVYRWAEREGFVQQA